MKLVPNLLNFFQNISLYKTGFLDFFCKTVFRCCYCYFYFYLVSLLLPFVRALLLFFLQYVHVCLYVCVCVRWVSVCDFDSIAFETGFWKYIINTWTYTCICTYIFTIYISFNFSFFVSFLAFGHRDFNFPLSAKTNPQLMQPTPLKLSNCSPHAQHTDIIPNS